MMPVGSTAKHRGLRAAASVICSIVLGAGFGVVAAAGMGMGMGMGFMAEVAAVFGAIAGLICSPALVFGLWHGPIFSGLAWIVTPTVVAAYVGGVLTSANGGPFLSMVVAISVYVLASCVRGIVGIERYRPRPIDACRSCGYDLTGLARGTVCPECGGTTMGAERR